MAAQGQAGVLHANETSYHNMCRFNSGFFFDHPLLQRYKWYWRVEPNVRFSCRITYDPFVAMAAHKKQYGYVTALWELDDTGGFNLLEQLSSFSSGPWISLKTQENGETVNPRVPKSPSPFSLSSLHFQATAHR